MRIRVDLGRCVASSNCVMQMPDVFAQDDDGLALVIDETCTGRTAAAVREVADSCPSQAIEVIDDDR